MIAFILAAGNAERHNGGNKPLLKVGDETLLERMVRQVRPHVKAIWIVTHRDDVTHPECSQLNPSSHEYVCDTLHSSAMLWCLGSRTIILLGDVWYSEWAISYILHYNREAAAFGEGCNVHALSIPYQHAFWVSSLLGDFRKMVRAGPVTHKHGKLYHFCDWVVPRIKKLPLDEYTTDIDSPQEHKRLLAKLNL